RRRSNLEQCSSVEPPEQQLVWLVGIGGDHQRVLAVFGTLFQLRAFGESGDHFAAFGRIEQYAGLGEHLTALDVFGHGLFVIEALHVGFVHWFRLGRFGGFFGLLFRAIVSSGRRLLWLGRWRCFALATSRDQTTRLVATPE